MLLRLTLFELKYHAGQVITRAAALIFFLLGLAMSRARFGDVGLYYNGAYTIIFSLTLLSVGSIIVISLLAGGAVLRDRESKMEPIIFSTGMTHSQYLLSRFAGLVCTAVLVVGCSAPGLFIGLLIPGLASEDMGPFLLLPFLQAFFVFIVPNVLIGCAVIFATAALGKNAMATYMSGIGLYILYWMGSMLGNSPLMDPSAHMSPEHSALATLMEPYGLVGIFEQTRFSTVLEKNTDLIALEGPFLLNRMLWIAVALALFALTYRFFTFRELASSKAKPEKPEPAPAVRTPYRTVTPKATSRFMMTFLAQTRLSVRTVIKGFPFYALLLVWTFLMVAGLRDEISGGNYAVPLFPMASIFLPVMIDTLLHMGTIVVVFFAAEIVWRERQLGMAELIDATPTTNAAFWLSKVAALSTLVFILVSYTIAIAIAIQLSLQYFDLNFALYASLFIRAGVPLILAAVFALLILTLVPNKYAGLGASFLAVICCTGFIFSKLPGIEHPLLRFGSTPKFFYSSMAGTGYHDPALWLYLAFWCCLAGLIGIATLSLWRRGTGRAALQLSSPVKISAAFCLLAGLILGSTIFYKTNIARTYRSKGAGFDRQATYERTYSDTADQPTPTVVEVKLAVDLFPDQRSYSASGTLKFQNQTDSPMTEVMIGIDPRVDAFELKLAQASLTRSDDEYRHYWYTFEQPLAAGGYHTLDFEVTCESSAFKALDSENYVLPKASYVEVNKVFPFFGYNKDMEISSGNARKKRDLPAYVSYPAAPEHVEDSHDHGTFDITVSTVTGQTVVAPGKVIKSWSEGERVYSQHVSEGLVPLSYGIASAVYETQQSEAIGIPITAYYTAGHEANVARLLDGARDSLTNFTRDFGPYPHSELKIAEIPRFSDIFAATAYPGTLFGVESRLYLLKQSEEYADVAYWMTSHEISHQWWGKTIDPAMVEGARMLTEFLAVYSEIMAYEREYGAEKTRQILDITNDMYFFFRGFEANAEMPLSRVGDQFFVSYFKGAQAAHALRQLVGEALINKALRQFLAESSYPKKPVAGDLVKVLYQHAPPKSHEAIHELLNEVVTYDLKIFSAVRAESGEITAQIQAVKTKVDETGTAQQGPLAGIVEVGLWREGELLGIERVRVDRERQEIRLTSNEVVDAISLDPRRLKIDADHLDNMMML